MLESGLSGVCLALLGRKWRVNVVQPISAISDAGAVGLRAPASKASPHRWATGILLVFLFLLMSRSVEFVPVPHVTLALSGILILTGLFTGQFVKVLQTPVVMAFTVLTGWLLITCLTSQWHGGSVQTLMNYWVSTYVSVLVVPALISTVRQCRQAVYTLGFALTAILILTSVFAGQVQGGRDAAAFGTLGNPNDFAFTLLLLMPFAILVVRKESLRNWKALLCAGTICFALVKVLRTGSRSGLVTIAVVCLILFLIGGVKARLKMLVVMAVVGGVLVTLVPQEIQLRDATIFDGTTATADMSTDQHSAVASTQARKNLFQESVRLMFEYPLFGVGPGIFSAALAGEQKSHGQVQTWHEAHNSFTQMGSETGIPGLLLYAGIVIYCLKRSISLYRQGRGNPSQVMVRDMAGALAIAMVVFVVCAIFGNYAYTFHLAVLAGLIQALDAGARKEREGTGRAMMPGFAAPAYAGAPLQQTPSAAAEQSSPALRRPGMSALQRRLAATQQHRAQPAPSREAVSSRSTDVRDHRVPHTHT